MYAVSLHHNCLHHLSSSPTVLGKVRHNQSVSKWRGWRGLYDSWICSPHHEFVFLQYITFCFHNKILKFHQMDSGNPISIFPSQYYRHSKGGLPWESLSSPTIKSPTMKSRSLSQPAWQSCWPSSPSSPRPSSLQSLAMDLLRYLSTFKTKDRGNVQALLWRFCPKSGRCTSHSHTFPAVSGKGVFFVFVFNMKYKVSN